MASSGKLPPKVLFGNTESAFVSVSVPGGGVVPREPVPIEPGDLRVLVPLKFSAEC